MGKACIGIVPPTIWAFLGQACHSVHFLETMCAAQELAVEAAVELSFGGLFEHADFISAAEAEGAFDFIFEFRNGFPFIRFSLWFR